MEDKVEKLLEVLKDLSLEEWNQIKNEVDIIYRDVEYKKVPNSQLETLKARLLCKKKVGLVFSSNPKN